MPKNNKTNQVQSYYVPRDLQRKMGINLNAKGFLPRGTLVTVVVEGGMPFTAIANGYGSIRDSIGLLKRWFASMGRDDWYGVYVDGGGRLVFPARTVECGGS